MFPISPSLSMSNTTSSLITICMITFITYGSNVMARPTTHIDSDVVSVQPSSVGIINGSCLSLDGKCHSESYPNSDSNMTNVKSDVNSTTNTVFNSSCLTCLGITEFMVVERDIFNMTVSNISKSIQFICGLFDNITLPGCSYMATFSRRVIGLDHIGMNVTQICRNISMC